MKKHDDNFISNVLKTDLLLLDYAQATDPKDKDAILEIVARYIYALKDKKVILMYSKICDSDEKEKDIYVEILMDLIAEYKAEIKAV